MWSSFGGTFDFKNSDFVHCRGKDVAEKLITAFKTSVTNSGNQYIKNVSSVYSNLLQSNFIGSLLQQKINNSVYAPLQGEVQSVDPASRGPIGKMLDDEQPELTPPAGLVSFFVPISFITSDNEDVDKFLSFPFNNIHWMGGNAPKSGDGMDSMSPLARNAAFQVYGTRSLYSLLMKYVNYTNDEFPGIFDLNHLAGMNSIGPMKSDPSFLCNSIKIDDCMDVPEAVFGNKLKNELLKIKDAVDPKHIFDVFPMVGYQGDLYEKIVVSNNQTLTYSELMQPL